MPAGGLEYCGLQRVDGPLLMIENIRDVAFNELVEITTPAGETRLGQVLDVSRSAAVIQVFAGTAGISNADTRIRFSGTTLKIPVAAEMLGRVFNGLGQPRDGLPSPAGIRSISFPVHRIPDSCVHRARPVAAAAH